MSFDVTLKTTVKIGTADILTVAERTFTGLTLQSGPRKKILNNAAGVLWDAAASGEITDFDLCLIVSDQPVQLELTCKEGDAQEELVSVPLEKNVAFALGSDDAYYTYTTDVYAGTLDVLDKIRAKELNSVAATITLWLFS